MRNNRREQNGVGRPTEELWLNCGSIPNGEKVFICFQNAPHTAGFYPAFFSVITEG